MKSYLFKSIRSFSIPAISAETKDRSYTKPVLIAILFLAAILRFAYLIESQSNPMPSMVSRDYRFDQFNYLSMAQDLVDNHWLGSKHPGHSPVYSYLIAVIYSIFGPDMNFIFIFQILYGILAVYLFYRCASLLFNNKNLGLLTAFVAATYSPFIYYECALLREAVIGYTNLTAFFFYLLALRKGKSKNYWIAGMLTALSFIVRAGIMPFFALAYVAIASQGQWKKRLRNAALVLAGMAVIVLPLTIRNYVSGFKAVSETSGPTLFWLGNSFDSPGIEIPYTKTYKKLTDETQGKILKTAEVLWREIKEHPTDYMHLYGRKFKMLFNGFEIPANMSYDLFKELSWILKIAPFNFVLISPLALLGLILFWRKYKYIEILYVFIFSLSVFVFIFHIQSRYRVAFLPFYIIAGSYSIFWFWQMLKKESYRAISIAGTLFLVFFIFTYPDRDILNRYFNGGIRAIDYSNLASSYLEKIDRLKLTGSEKEKCLNKSLEYYSKAVPYLPDDMLVSVYITEGMVYLDLGMPAKALESFSCALEYDPHNQIALKHYNRLAAQFEWKLKLN